MIGLAALMAAATGAPPPLPVGQNHYSQSCGGCHGLRGVSARPDIPVLRDRVGLFLCSREGREYVVRLPNVAFAAMDDATLAAALNFMMFALGGRSVPGGIEARAFSTAEVRTLRARPLKAGNLVALRDEALAHGDPACLARFSKD